MKKFLKPYAPVAKFLLGAAAVGLVTVGYYDQATMTSIIGGVSAFAVAFWEFYDRFISSDE